MLVLNECELVRRVEHYILSVIISVRVCLYDMVVLIVVCSLVHIRWGGVNVCMHGTTYDCVHAYGMYGDR